MEIEIGIEVGQVCNRNKCKGVITEKEIDGGCSCHINPPCSFCETLREKCEECGWDADDEAYLQLKERLKHITPRSTTPLNTLKIEDDGSLYKIVRYFDTFPECIVENNLSKSQAYTRRSQIIKERQRHYVSFEVRLQSEIIN